MLVPEIQPVGLAGSGPTHAGSLGVRLPSLPSGAFLRDRVRGSGGAVWAGSWWLRSSGSSVSLLCFQAVTPTVKQQQARATASRWAGSWLGIAGGVCGIHGHWTQPPAMF